MGSRANQPDTWLLIDATNAVYRDFHAAGVDRVATLFRDRVRAMGDLWEPVRIVAAFDAPGPTFRHELYPEYKAGRDRPAGIAAALAEAMAMLLDEGVDVQSVRGFEADDIIATLTAAGTSADARVVVVSADKDLHQLIAEGSVCQLAAVRRDGRALDCKWINARDVEVRYGVKPGQWVDYRAMVGDKSDNIPGVTSIGPEAAARVLRACGSLDDFYLSPFAATLNERQHARMIAAKPTMPLMRQLLTLRTDVPITQGAVA
ncbi:DNA polymerase I, thermostable [Crateriforma conspicua]|uniref:DNA polymerase I, thermostable n=1 Tax=Crateriforma conspicua TaxID=2527996 RepID=A0A5C6FY11_9PLAN|nr:5'-3' exonuclease H3TH domain-containing protein [Crateriforma conspicua]TWU67276.1 DNA polymerase I, thermostable [Crateriforma conspicua]